MSDAGVAFEIIRSVTRTILESREIQPALDAVTRQISEKMGVEVCSIYLRDGDRLRLSAGHGLNRGAHAGVTLEVGEGLTGSVYETGEILNIAHPGRDARFRYFPDLGEEKLESFMGIPIPPGKPAGDGVLILQGVESVPFGPTVEDLAYTLAAQLGTLLETRLHPSVPLPGAGSAPQPPAPARARSVEAPTFLRAQTAFGGVADGVVLALKTQQVWDTVYFVECDDPAEELRALERALERAREESRRLRQKAGEIFAEIDARIFETHEQLLADEGYVDLMRAQIRDRRTTAVFAVKLATRETAKAFQDSGVPMLAARAADLRDVGLRLLNALGEANDRFEPAGDGPEPGVIVMALELLPSDLVYLQSRHILGILCETGGSTSHAAILARSLDVPCFIGIPGLTGFLSSGTRVILDGNSGLVYIRPDAHVVREYQRLMTAARSRPRVNRVAGSERTRDGHPIRISGNVSLISDLNLMQRFGIQGVGLYRSEFFFMIRNSFPDEDAQFAVYSRVMERCGGHGVTFRLLDVGGDKPLKYFDWGREENPSLGWRSIRMLLQRPEILTPHLRALLRAAQLGDMRVVLPMISTLRELRELKARIHEAARILEAEKGRPLRVPPVGIMIEIPSTVLQIEAFLAESDFLCLGTNDLIQYLFAIDRGNERVAEYHHPYHPPFLHALKRVADASAAAGKPVTVCGEMAADPIALPLLLGLGLTSLSIAPGAADAVREALERMALSDCRELVERLLGLSTADEVLREANAFAEREAGPP